MSSLRSWKGTLGFGVLSIPVALIGAVESDKGVVLHELAEGERGWERVRRQRVDGTGEPVEAERVVRAAECGAQHVPLSEEEVKACRARADRRLALDSFVPLASIPRVLFDKPYWLIPESGGEEAYAVLARALERARLAATGTFVLRSKQYVVAVYPVEGRLVAHCLFWPGEIAALPTVDRKPDKHAVDAAVALIRESASEAFDGARYENTYQANLTKLVNQKLAEGGGVRLAGDEAEKPAEVVDLLAAMRATIEQRKNPRPPRRGAKVGAA